MEHGDCCLVVVFVNEHACTVGVGQSPVGGDDDRFYNALIPGPSLS